MTVSIDLSGRTALVTGASKGIGRGIATTLVEAGASVMLSSRKQDTLDAVAAELGGDVATFAANVGDPEGAQACVWATVERFGSVDILVNNAATNPYYGPTIDAEIGHWDKIVQVNLRGPFTWIQAAWRTWMQEHGGSVINVVSVGGLRHGGGIGVYNVSKAGLLHLTRVLAAELGPGVRVNALAPGLVDTDFAKVLVDNFGEAVAAALPLGRIGQPPDLAGAALFLASDLSSWLTGEVLVVDGGQMVALSR